MFNIISGMIDLFIFFFKTEIVLDEKNLDQAHPCKPWEVSFLFLLFSSNFFFSFLSTAFSTLQEKGEKEKTKKGTKKLQKFDQFWRLSFEFLSLLPPYWVVQVEKDINLLNISGKYVVQVV